MPGFVILVFLVVGIIIWVASTSFDKDRIREYIQGRGGRVISIVWSPFGKGWFGEKSDRIYDVVYYDAEGLQYLATCKTSLFTRVYWTEDRVSHGRAVWYDKAAPASEPSRPLIQDIPQEWLADPADAPVQEDAATELRRLRQENARLRAKLGEHGGAAIDSSTTCSACGATLPYDATVCLDCGASVR